MIAVVVLLRSYGLSLNVTDSMPIGVYHLERLQVRYAGVLAPGTLEQIAHRPLVTWRLKSGGTVKQPDRRRPRA